MPYDFLIGNKSNYSEDPSKKKQTYQESLRTKLTMDPKAMFLASPPIAGAGLKEPKYPVDFPSIRIGSQIWTSQNLDITTLYDGTPIIEAGSVSGDGSIDAYTLQAADNGTPLWSWREFDSSDRYPGYGKWYSSAVIDNLKLNPPRGWRVPTNNDWQQLKTHFDNSEGGYIKGPDNLNLWDYALYFDTSAKFNAVPSGFSSIELGSFDHVYPPVALGTYNAKLISAYWTSDSSYSIYYLFGAEAIGNISTFTDAIFAVYGSSNYFGKYGMAPIRFIKE
jgi:uncharacterized protein (TIGR02145 family)